MGESKFTPKNSVYFNKIKKGKLEFSIIFYFFAFYFCFIFNTHQDFTPKLVSPNFGSSISPNHLKSKKTLKSTVPSLSKKFKSTDIA